MTKKNQRISDLFELWKHESKTRETTQTESFSEFIRRYSNDIFTRSIAKGLYDKICNGNFDSWLKWLMALVVAQLKNAIRGDTRSFNAIRDIIGEKPKDN